MFHSWKIVVVAVVVVVDVVVVVVAVIVSKNFDEEKIVFYSVLRLTSQPISQCRKCQVQFSLDFKCLQKVFLSREAKVDSYTFYES